MEKSNRKILLYDYQRLNSVANNFATRSIRIYERKEKLLALTCYLCMVLFGILAGIAAGIILIPIAYADRGYFAIGGEWVIVISVSVLTSCAIKKFYKFFSEKG